MSAQARQTPRHHAYTVEQCRVLDAGRLTRGLSPIDHQAGSLDWTRAATGQRTATIGFEVLTAIAEGIVRLYYCFPDTSQDIDYTVTLTTTVLPWGGRRWWFRCPVVRDGDTCGRRVGKLYLPPGGARYFGCRHCYNLTYESCRESHRDDGLARLLAAEQGSTVAEALRDLARFRRPQGRRSR